MADPLSTVVLTAAANKLTTLVIETGWKGGSGLFGWIGKNVDAGIRQKIFNASQKYIENYRERHCLLKVSGMRKPVDLETVYTAVRFLDEKEIRQFASVEALEAAYREKQRRRFQPESENKREGVKVASTESCLMVLGGPGAGKSTFLRRMGLEALKGKGSEFQHRCIPVFIELKRLTSSEIDLEEIIAEEFQTCGFPDAKGFTRKALDHGRLLILLDGLDEVPVNNLNQAVAKIQDFVDRYDQNRYIASCRTAAYHGGFRRFTDVAMADFEDDQIQQFIQNWFQTEEDCKAKTSEKCWEALQKPENQGAKELAHTPLLLTFLCLVYDRSQSFPSNRSVLYRKALRILLEEWAAEKRLENQQKIYEGLSIELEEILLSEIACQGFESDRLFFSQRDIVGKIKTFLASNLNAPQHLDGEAVLDAIAVQQGILVERAEDAYSFSHLTLQEYLTAQYIDDHRRIEPLVQQHLTDERWREVFLLVAGLMRGGADDLLLLMEKQAKTYVNIHKLQALLRWAEGVTEGSEGDYKPAAKRAVAIYLARARDLACDSDLSRDPARDPDLPRGLAYALPGDLARARDLARALPGDLARARDLAYALPRDLARALEFKEIKVFKSVDFTTLTNELEVLRLKVPDNDQPHKVRRNFTDQISRLWFRTLHLDSETTKLTQDEVKALNDYFYANELIVRCKEAAVRVLPEIWAGIEERMMTVRMRDEG
ncbi:NACHT domain-containing protein [Oculatella sp. FACHB-28]|uniref:NACHT domain-containing protein n=1 Tax=Oculatella sp. FACHB-28 TaxID=2692845 RepID=UPI00168809A1|nr:NACHT domain-containing protein [Oculatella sp. FACHB-28]MBD2056797.1 NACHT domain-containing protein [Oculatella sp. FACHB-28]